MNGVTARVVSTVDRFSRRLPLSDRARRWIGPATLCALLGAPGFVSADTRVVFTVDVESNEAHALPDQIDTVCQDGSACGLMEIVRLLKERHWSGTFFLDVYEHRKWGETALRTIAVRLQDSGQDVGLHTHPHWAYDPARWGMNQYTLEEQTAIVGDGVRLLKSWTGRPVVSHRAGAYAADENTMIALERSGITVDSSVFWQYPNSRLDGLGLLRSFPSSYGRIAEIPVTVYRREERPRFLESIFAPVTAIRKIDPDWFVNETEMRGAVDAAFDAKLPVLVVFLHSFSLMSPAEGRPVPNRHAMEMLRATLDYISLKQATVVTMRDLSRLALPASTAAQDIVPAVALSAPWPRYGWHRVKASGGLQLSLAAAAALVLGGILIAMTRGRKRRGRGLGNPAAAHLSVRPSGVRSR
jgi:peptidoglycan/xylan/chitin deacetylase (PgdA/CDA1 family)